MWLNNIEEQILSKFKIKRAEKTLVLWSLILACVVEAGRCYLDVVSMSLFLMHFNSKNLPQIYLINAGLIVIVGYIYSFLASRLTFNRLTMTLILFIGGVTLLIGGLLKEVTTPWIFAVLIVWSIAAKSLLDLGLWSVFNQIYNLQQGKRLFGTFRASQSIGGLVAGMVLPIFLFIMSAEQVVPITGLFVILASLILVKLLKTQRDFSEGASSTSSQASKPLINIWHDRYILKLMGIVLLGIFTQYTIALLFNTVAKEHYPNKESLSSFLGIFSGLGYGLDLLLNLVVYRWIMERYGVIIGAMLCPLLLAIMGIIILTLNVIPPLYVLIFWFVSALRSFDLNFRHAIAEGSNALLLQPLSPNLRKLVLSKNKMLITPVAIALISIILMILANTVGIKISWFILAVLLFCFSSILINRTLKPDYIAALSKAIKQRYMITADFHPPKESLPLFKKALQSPHPDEVLYALSALEEINKPTFINELKVVFKSHDATIQQIALEKIGQYKVMDVYDDILSMLDTESSDTLKAQAISTLAELNYEKARFHIEQLAKDTSSIICRASLIAMVRSGDDSALEKISSMFDSDKTSVRVSAVYIIGEINNNHTNVILESAVSDPSERVQIEALRAIIKTGYIKCFNDVLKRIHLLELSGPLLQRFLAMGPLILPIIKNNFLSYSHVDQLKLLYVMGSMQFAAAAEFLERMVLTSKGDLRQTALRSLKPMNARVSEGFYESLRQKINDEAEYLKEHYATLEMIPVLEITELLHDTLKRKISLSVERLLLFIAMLYHNKSIIEVKVRLETGTIDEIGYALELLEESLSTEHKAILPILANIYLMEASSKGELSSVSFKTYIKTQLQNVKEEYLAILSCIASLYIIKFMERKDFNVELEELKQSESPIIQETLTWLEIS